MTLIDLSHVIESGMTTYPGLPGPVVCDYLTREASRSRYSDGATFHIGKIEMVANTGTYVDAPFHRYEGRMDVADLPLDRVADLDTVVVSRDPGRRMIGPEAFAGLSLRGKALLINTGWSRHF